MSTESEEYEKVDILGREVYTLEDSDEEIEIIEVDDRPPKDRVPPRNPNAKDADYNLEEEIEGVDDKVSKRIKKLTYEYNEERRAKEAAFREREEAIKYAKNLREMLDRGEEVLVREVKARTTAELDKAREAVKDAYEEGDAELIAKATETLNDAKYRSMMAEAYVPQRPQEQEPVQERPQPQQKALEWHKRNQWFGQDKKKTIYANAINNMLLEDGVDPNSDEFYRKIDEAVENQFGSSRETPVHEHERHEVNNDVEEIRAEERDAPKRVVASGNRNSGSRKQVHLTSSQMKLIKRLGLTPEQYAKETLKLEKQGDRNV